jgi:hypothetical protein
MTPSAPSETLAAWNTSAFLRASQSIVSPLRRDQPQGRDVAVQGLDHRPRAVRARGQRPGQGLFVDVGQIGHGSALRRQDRAQRAQPRAGRHDRLVALPGDDPRQGVQRDQRPRGGDQGCERMACPHGTDRRGGGLQGLRRPRSRSWARRGRRDRRAARPTSCATAGGPGRRWSTAPAVLACRVWRPRSRRRRRPRPNRRRRGAPLVSIPSSAPPPQPYVSGIFAPRHEAYQSVEIVRVASGALSTGRHGLEALNGMVEQHGLAPLPARIPGLAVMDQRRARAREWRGRPCRTRRTTPPAGVGRSQGQGLLRRRRRRDGSWSNGQARQQDQSGCRGPGLHTIRRSRSGAWRR